jgi:hypothetical protein
MTSKWDGHTASIPWLIHRIEGHILLDSLLMVCGFKRNRLTEDSTLLVDHTTCYSTVFSLYEIAPWSLIKSQCGVALGVVVFRMYVDAELSYWETSSSMWKTGLLGCSQWIGITWIADMHHEIIYHVFNNFCPALDPSLDVVTHFCRVTNAFCHSHLVPHCLQSMPVVRKSTAGELCIKVHGTVVESLVDHCSWRKNSIQKLQKSDCAALGSLLHCGRLCRACLFFKVTACLAV